MPHLLTVGVCMCDGMTLSDFIPPLEILAPFNMADDPVFGEKIKDIPYRFKVDYLAPSMKPVPGLFPILPSVTPTQTYDAATKSGIQFDIIWVPAGPIPRFVDGALKDVTPKEVIEFIKNQAPGAKYVLSVCGGALAFASAGVLENKRATTNKGLFRLIQAISSDKITWVPKARWVVDGNIWTSSGISSGQDMTLAFVEHLTNQEVARQLRGMCEVRETAQDEDPFAEFHDLV